MNIQHSMNVFISALINDLDDAKMNLSVTFGGDTAYCRKVGANVSVNIPTLDPKCNQQKSAAYSYALHEAGHAKYTCFDTGSEVDGFLATLHNLCEDAFIEQKLCARFPGAKSKLLWLRTYLKNKNVDVDLDDLSVNTLLFNFIYNVVFSSNGYSTVYDISVGSYRTALLNKGIKESWLDGLVAIILKNKSSKTTLDTLLCAKEIFAYLKEEEEQQSSEQELDTDNTNSQGQAQGDGKEGDDSQNQSQDLEQGDDNGVYQADSEDEGLSESVSIQALEEAAQETDLDAGGVMESLLSESSGNFHDKAPEEVKCIERHMCQPPKFHQIDGNSTPTLSEEPVKELASKASAFLSRSLLGFVQSSRELPEGRGRRGRRLVRNVATSLSNGNRNLFRKKITAQDECTHFHVLLDCSGSMRGDRQLLATASILALLNSLKNFSFVETSVYAFGYKADETAVALVKTPEESNCLSKLARLTTNGLTPLHIGLTAVAMKACISDNSRHVVFVVTDGVPDNPAAAKHVLSEIDADDSMEAYGLMIGEQGKNTMQLMFENRYEQVLDVGDLPKAIFSIAKRSLI